jgi:hypothetical protein
MKLRSELGHNEFIPTSILKIARKLKEKSRKSLAGQIDEKGAIYRPNFVSKRWKKSLRGVGAFSLARKGWNIIKAKREAKKQDKPTEVDQPDAQEEKQQEEEQVEDLDDLLQAEPEYEEEDMEKKIKAKLDKRAEEMKSKYHDEYEEEDMDDILAEQEYEEEDCHQKCPDGHKEVKHFNSGRRGCKPADVSTPVVNEEGDDDDGGTVTFQQAVDELEISDAQALNHLVAFVGDHTDIRTRVMKGKARYIEKLQAYVDGDDTAEIRMYNGTKMRIANLKPDRESLSKALQAFPSGPHFIECD